MSAFNIGGLVSGIDTSSLIDQLMTVAAQPQTALKNQVSAQQRVTSAYQAVNTKLAAVQTAADALSDAATWSATTATSSSTSVVATGSSTAQAGTSANFSVTQIATAQISTVAVSSSTIADPATGIDIVDSAGTTHHLNLGGGTAADVATAVNNAGIGLRASIVNTDSGQVLQFTSSTTGASAAFTVNGLTSPVTTVVAAQDAKIAVGDPAAGGYTVSSATNTFTDAIPGVTFTVSAPVSNVTVTLASDEASIATKSQALVDSVNAALKEIAGDTAPGAVLSGDSLLRSLQQSLLSVVSTGTSAGKSYAPQGVQLTSTGTLTFDAKAFAAAFTADPAGTRGAIATSLAASFSAVASDATSPGVGSLTREIQSGNDNVTALNKRIAAWDTRLASQRTALQTKYTAMETALSKLKSQSSYLSSVLGSNNSSSSSGSSSSSLL